MNNGRLIVFSGPSGAGKDTVLGEILKQRDDTVLSISVTTRAPRTGEIDGVHYFFRTREEFERLVAENALLEYAEYSGNCYGTPRRWVESMLCQGKNVILEIDVQGAMKVMDNEPDVLSVFITAPSLAVLEERLRARKTDSEDVIEQRMHEVKREIGCAFRYDYIVINDELQAAVDRLNSILDGEEKANDIRTDRMKDRLEDLLC